MVPVTVQLCAFSTSQETCVVSPALTMLGVTCRSPVELPEGVNVMAG